MVYHTHLFIDYCILPPSYFCTFLEKSDHCAPPITSFKGGIIDQYVHILPYTSVYPNRPICRSATCITFRLPYYLGVRYKRSSIKLRFYFSNKVMRLERRLQCFQTSHRDSELLCHVRHLEGHLTKLNEDKIAALKAASDAK